MARNRTRTGGRRGGGGYFLLILQLANARAGARCHKKRHSEPRSVPRETQLGNAGLCLCAMDVTITCLMTRPEVSLRCENEHQFDPISAL